MRDPKKARARARRYRARKHAARYGLGAGSQIGRHGNHAKGARNARWAGGRWESPQGYIGVAVPEGHHLRMANGYAYEHQLVAEKKLGRRLEVDETTHHVNGNRCDNRPENIVIVTPSEHARIHTASKGCRDALGRFTGGARSTDPAEWPADLRAREFPA